MKSNFRLLPFILLLSSCSTHSIVNNFNYFDILKRHEFSLKINKDSTYILEGVSGCDKLRFAGSVRKLDTEGYACYELKDNNSLLLDSIRQLYFYYKEGVPLFSYKKNEMSFYYSTVDTLLLTPTGKILINGQLFDRKHLFRQKNVNKEFVKNKQNEFIEIYGKDIFINVFGDSVSVKRGKENLSRNYCAE